MMASISLLTSNFDAIGAQRTMVVVALAVTVSIQG